MTEQELHALVMGFLVPPFGHDVLVLGAIDLLRLEGLDEGNSFRDSGLEVCQGLLVIFIGRGLNTRQPGDDPCCLTNQ